MAVEARATAKYIRTSAQKAGLVLNLIRGRDVNSALATLRFARKGVARDIEKVLRSAIANGRSSIWPSHRARSRWSSPRWRHQAAHRAREWWWKNPSDGTSPPPGR